MTNLIDRVLGYTLSAKPSKHGSNTLTKRLFDVKLGKGEDGKSKVLLISPVKRAKTRVIHFYDPTDHQKTLPLLVTTTSKREVVIELTLEEWEQLEKGNIIKRLPIKTKTSEINRYISLDLDKILEIPDLNFEDWQINTIREDYIKA